ncbi:Gfo/Idh/MocA family oxidoreductase [Luteolibacter arcticus]|uniref:Gfo/Idh/MocA family oxidoreductase n=1 Tax=Luteolibacter arcticus TaxID=1581411 RepID=A0ABT3GNT6_9BACT|nr:Gfo/Idh/MocA family oxidoreductase [Luteolibacter arcticus]MCW1925167.1 Gfo/Idh/MocA family oxidoreductase [Luteolibacter arcticus]
MHPPLRYGLIGCGGFGRFCLKEYSQMEEVVCVAVADDQPDLAAKTGEAFQLHACATPQELLDRTDIDLIHLATPPFTHASLATAALEAGFHVLCEKPLATTMVDAEKLVRLAAERGRILAVNLIMRYNPLCQAVKALVESRILGDPLHAQLVNAAQDETLGAGHWFWDPEKSGGIFIEHGVHFFDLFEWWFGAGEVLSAQQMTRPGTDIIDQVQCAVKYGDTTLANFYHGFHQMLRRDQQAWLILFEQGTLRMREWVPTQLELDATLSEAGLEALVALLPGAKVEIVERYGESERQATSRHRSRTVDVRINLVDQPGLAKHDLYGQMLRDLLRDQIEAIRDATHRRTVSEANGLSSLAYATAAQALADRR